MSEHHEPPLPPMGNDDDVVIRLLGAAGPRESVPETRAARVRTAVHAEWHAHRRRRSLRRRIALAAIGMPLAATAVFVGVNSTAGNRSRVVVNEPVAVVERVDGFPQRRSSVGERSAAHPLRTTDTVLVGDWIAADAHARVVLRFPDGTSVRVDRGSRIRALAGRVLELSAGAVYVDTGREGRRFEIRTPLATATDVGTQFELRILDDAVRLRVRSGLVELTDATRSIAGREGTEVTLSAGRAETRKVASHGPQWEWVDGTAPALIIEGLPLSVVIDRVAHEYGWRVHYTDPALAREASGVIVHGSVSGLTPRDALDVAVGASGLRHRIEDGTVIVLSGADDKERPRSR